MCISEYTLTSLSCIPAPVVVLAQLSRIELSCWLTVFMSGSFLDGVLPVATVMKLVALISLAWPFFIETNVITATKNKPNTFTCFVFM